MGISAGDAGSRVCVYVRSMYATQPARSRGKVTVCRQTRCAHLDERVCRLCNEQGTPLSPVPKPTRPLTRRSGHWSAHQLGGMLTRRHQDSCVWQAGFCQIRTPAALLVLDQVGLTRACDHSTTGKGCINTTFGPTPPNGPFACRCQYGGHSSQFPSINCLARLATCTYSVHSRSERAAVLRTEYHVAHGPRPPGPGPIAFSRRMGGIRRLAHWDLPRSHFHDVMDSHCQGIAEPPNARSW